MNEMDLTLDHKYLFGKMPSKMKRVDKFPDSHNEKLPKEIQETIEKINNGECQKIVIDSI